MKDMDHKDWKY